MPELPRPEELGVEGWTHFHRGGIRAIPGGFDSATAEQLRARGWDIERDGPVFEIDYTGRREAIKESEADVEYELERIQARRQAERDEEGQPRAAA
jgi:hypothetical protein